MSNLIRGISENGGVVFCGVDSTEIVRTAEKLHTTSATCSAALGRLLTGVSLMGAMLKDDGDSITLRVSGGGPAGVVIACTDAHGNVKGCIDHPLVELPRKGEWTSGCGRCSRQRRRSDCHPGQQAAEGADGGSGAAGVR
ncbi:MAG: Hsp33 family molecular chaperone HslO [Faecalibacterium prausnitzii]